MPTLHKAVAACPSSTANWLFGPAFRLVCVLACTLAWSVDAYAKADPNKIVREVFEAADDGFDIMRTNSGYSQWLAEAVFESLLQYDFLARPPKLVPGTAEAMPEMTDGGKTYLFHIKKGIYFTPDPAFKGVRRELVAADYAYTIKRLVDPNNRSPHSNLFADKIEGLAELVAAAQKSGRFDYDAPLAGLETPERHTLRIRLKAQERTFAYYLAKATTAAVAREVIEHYGDDTGRHPVGTGGYLLKQYVARSKIVLEANPDHRGFVWDFKPDGGAWDARLVHDMQGKHMPQVGRVEISIIEESQSRWLAFASGQIDIFLVTDSATGNALNQKGLKPELAAKGVNNYRYTENGIVYTFFNFKDATVGGYGKEKIALRRAIAMAFDIDALIEQIYQGQAIRAQSALPPGVAGHDPAYRSSIPHDPALANRLLDRFGYRKGADGFRTMPDGQALTLKISSAPSSKDIAKMQLWRRSLERVGLRAEYPVAGFADNLKAGYQCRLMMWGLSDLAGIPDGTEMMNMYFGPNAMKGNFGCYQSDDFDSALRQALLLPDGQERQKLFHKMERILERDTVQVAEVWRIRNWLTQPWLKGFKRHPNIGGHWQYLDVEKH